MLRLCSRSRTQGRQGAGAGDERGDAERRWCLCIWAGTRDGGCGWHRSGAIAGNTSDSSGCGAELAALVNAEAGLKADARGGEDQFGILADLDRANDLDAGLRAIRMGAAWEERAEGVFLSGAVAAAPSVAEGDDDGFGTVQREGAGRLRAAVGFAPAGEYRASSGDGGEGDLSARLVVFAAIAAAVDTSRVARHAAATVAADGDAQRQMSKPLSAAHQPHGIGIVPGADVAIV